MRIAAVQHLKNAGGPAGLGPRVRGRKWCHAVHCCPVLFVWQPHCTEGLPTSWELMGLALHTLFPRPHWSVNPLIRASPGVFEGGPGVPSRVKTISCSFLAHNMWEEWQEVAKYLFVVIHGRLFRSDNETLLRDCFEITFVRWSSVWVSGLVWVRTQPRGHLINLRGQKKVKGTIKQKKTVLFCKFIFQTFLKSLLHYLLDNLTSFQASNFKWKHLGGNNRCFTGLLTTCKHANWWEVARAVHHLGLKSQMLETNGKSTRITNTIFCNQCVSALGLHQFLFIPFLFLQDSILWMCPARTVLWKAFPNP